MTPDRIDLMKASNRLLEAYVGLRNVAPLSLTPRVQEIYRSIRHFMDAYDIHEKELLRSKSHERNSED